MLKIDSQLGRALRYQSSIGTERTVGHFDDSAKDLAGPPGRNHREVVHSAAIQPAEGTRAMGMRIDPATNSIVAFFADEG